MKRDQGLSLIELIVVIAIMAVLVSVVGISITVVSRQRVSNAASDVRGQFQTAQTISMSKDNCHVQIKKNSNNEVVFTVYSSANSILDKATVNKNITVKVHYSQNANADNPNLSGWTTIGASGVNIFYVRESGAFEDKVRSDDGTVGTDYIDRIAFISGSKTVVLKLTLLTGKVSY